AAAGARLLTTPVHDEGWDLETCAATLRRSRPAMAYLIADFQNPTGRLMSEAERTSLASVLAHTRTTAMVDEAHHGLALDGPEVPPPLAAYLAAAGGEAITVGGISKLFWGGLRVGWLRAPLSRMAALTEARLTMDLGVPVLEQLVTIRLLADPDEALTAHRLRLREQRDALTSALAARLPDWSFRVPSGGLALWCRLPLPHAVAVSIAAEERGVVVAPGPVFAPYGGLASRLRIPFTRPVDELTVAVDRLADAWVAVLADTDSRESSKAGEPGVRRNRGPDQRRVMVA
ncbi:MAG: aminotransferase class I/II-fold pyridoxal phosphate-dependent enzyme, partial [Nocardioides sp.]